MENGKNELKSTFSTRYVYNSNFVNTNLLDKQYIDRLKSVCTYTSDSVSYSAMVKRKVLYNVQKATNDSVECSSRNPSRTARDSISRVDKIARGKITGQNGSPSNAKTGLCPNMKNVTGQRAPRVNTISCSMPHDINALAKTPTSKDHFLNLFLFFCLWTFMNCGTV